MRNLITPMVSGIWAGDPARMSIAHSFPIMKQLERDGGSLLRGAMRHMKRVARERRAAGKPRRVKNLVSFRDGLDRLPAALAATLGFRADDHSCGRYQPATRIHEIRPLTPAGDDSASSAGGFQVTAEHDGRPQVWQARELVIAAEADHAARWLEGFDGGLATTLRSFPYNRLVAVGLGLAANEARLPAGFGFLAPRGEGIRLLGAIVNSNFLPGRAPAGGAALTIFIGGELDPDAADLPDAALEALLRQDLGLALGWNGRVLSRFIERWPRAIPQYDMNHGRRLAEIERAEARWPGLRLMGNWRGGVSIGDRVEYTHRLADEIIRRVGERAG